MSTRAELKQATQIQFPGKAVLRTLVQIGIPAFIGLVIVIPLIIEAVLAEVGEFMPESLRLWLLGAATFITAVGLAITRVMAIPAVNHWLGKLGLAATPVDNTSDAAKPVSAAQAAADDSVAAQAAASRDGMT